MQVEFKYEEEFDDMLAKRGLDKAAFAQLMLNVRKDAPHDYLVTAVEQIEENYKPAFQDEPPLPAAEKPERDDPPRDRRRDPERQNDRRDKPPRW